MEAGYEAFDMKRMFVGDFSLLLAAEIAVRTTIMYTFALLAVRFLGKRGVGSLSPFEYVLVFALGSATGDPIFYPEVPILHGVIVITAIVLLQKAVQRLAQRNERVERYLESHPALIIDGGRIKHDMLKSEDLSLAEVLMELRLAGVTNVGQVRYAYLEPSGEVSVFRYDEGTFTPGQSTLVTGD